MKIKILQWNVWIKENPTNIANEILRIKPDIVCAQEIKQNLNQNVDFIKTISEITKYNFFYKEAVTWDNRTDVTSQGNAIFTKFPIINSSSEFIRPFKHNPANATKEGRVYIESEIDLGPKRINIGTIHMPFSYKFRNTKVRKNEADKLCEILRNKNTNYIFTGDLNSIPDSYIVNNILTKTNLRNAGPDFDQKTWTTKPFDYHGFVGKDLDWRIDYVFTSKDLRVINSEIIKTEFSDHLPIFAEIEI